MKKIIVIAALLLAAGAARAQNFAVKTNAVGWATKSINAAFEVGLGKRTTLELGGQYNPWSPTEFKRTRHWLAQPELRFWLCERFSRGFFGVHLIGGQFNVGGIDTPFDIFPTVKDFRYQGWVAGGGVSYGHDWYLSPHFNLEATAGVGYVHAKYSRYECRECGTKLDTGKKNYFGPTKLAVNLVYLF